MSNLKNLFVLKRKKLISAMDLGSYHINYANLGMSINYVTKNRGKGGAFVKNHV